MTRAQIAVVGAGPAGIAAACAAAELGASVVVLDGGPAPGGQIWRAPTRTARGWLGRLQRSGARFEPGLHVVDVESPRTLVAEREGRAQRIHAERLVLCPGARELFLPFPGWTLPDVVGVGAAQALIHAGLRVRGRRAVVAGTGPLLLPTAAALAGHGARVAVVAEQAPLVRLIRFAAGLVADPTRCLEAIRLRARFASSRYRAGVFVESARGPDSVAEVTLSDGRRRWSESCDLLCCAYGLVPNLELPRLVGCTLDADSVWVDGDQATSVDGVFCAGEPTGIGGAALALAEGEIAGRAAAGRPGGAPRLRERRQRERRFARRLGEAFALRSELRHLPGPDTIVCRCEDVPLGRLREEWTPRQAKLYTRSGMGSCQGRVCGPALRFLFGWGMDRVRSPVEPAAIRTLSGEVAPRPDRDPA